MNKTELINLLIGYLPWHTPLASSSRLTQPRYLNQLPTCTVSPSLRRKPACTGSDPSKSCKWLPLPLQSGQMPLTGKDRGLLETFVSGPMFF